MVDRTYCASSYLMYRTVVDESKRFHPKLEIQRFSMDFPKIPVASAQDLYAAVQKQMAAWTADGKAALALSGGIDSAILAKFFPAGSTAYTFQCVVPGVEVTNEVPQAAKYARECGLRQVVVPIGWEDCENYAPLLMAQKGAPLHSIEIQIYKAALQAKADGFERLIFGECCDVNYGGMSGLMAKDWKYGEFVDRYMFTKPYHVLKDWTMDCTPFLRCEAGGYVDAHEFCRTLFAAESMGSYVNACKLAGIAMETPYVRTRLALPLDYGRVRAGENKYLVREVFSALYPAAAIPPKLPMPRPTDEWLKAWEGPRRPEFWPHCTDGMTGDQKWQVWCLERFLDLLDEMDEMDKMDKPDAG